MLKKLKKGFTLAELLIVVAIVAVLTAIAVPLFVNAVTDAKDARDGANIRAFKVEASIYLLACTNDDAMWPDGILGWSVGGEIDTTGKITVDVIAAVTDDAKIPAEPSVIQDSKGVWKITSVWLPVSEVELKS